MLKFFFYIHKFYSIPFLLKYYEISLKLYYKKHYFATINRILCNDIHTTITFLMEVEQ